jgi:hypothetical protein
LPIESPIPFNANSFSLVKVESSTGNLSIVYDAEESDFALKLLSPCISINLASSERLCAIAELFIAVMMKIKIDLLQLED